MEWTDALARWLTLVTLASAALAALGYLIRLTMRAAARLQALQELTDHELTHNGGSSMKDDVATIARAVGELQADIRELRHDKESEHRALQLQLDSVHHELGTRPRHKREGERQ